MTLSNLINTFVVLFVVIDPIGVTTLFAALTREGDPCYRRRMAIKGTGLAAAILIVFAVGGDYVLKALGIGIPAFNIAGGILLFLLAIDMIFARQSGLRSTTVAEQAEARYKADVSVFPLAFPLIAGPGTLTTLLLFTRQLHGNLPGQAVLYGMLVLVLALTLGALLLASPIMRLMGETGSNVVGRILGVVLAALAVQFVVNGIRVAFLHGT